MAEAGEYLFDLAAGERGQADFRRPHAARFDELKAACSDRDEQTLARPAPPAAG